MNSLKDSEKTNDNIFNTFNLLSSYLTKTELKRLQTLGFILRDYDYQHNKKNDFKEYLCYLINELITIYDKL